jgi:acetolactate synthase-1/2/3 large subunit
VTDIPSGMQLVGELLPPSAWDLDAVHRTLVAQRQRLCPPSPHLTAHRVVRIAADAAASQARVTVDAGAHMFPATMLWPVDEPNGMLISNGLSTMGFALPAAIGAALADREGGPGAIHDHGAPVVALTGDGGLLMCSGELLTAVRERLQVIVIVFADASGRRHGNAAPAPSSGVTLGADVGAGIATASARSASGGDGGGAERGLARALAHCGRA